MSITNGQGTKVREEIWLSPDVRTALGEYARKHKDRFRNDSQAADHMLRRALLSNVDEGTEGLVLPSVRRTVETAVKAELAAIREDLLGAVRQEVRETARRETEDVVAKHTRALGNRVAALLVNAGKDAHVAVRLCLTLLEYDLEDPGRVRAYHEEAQLAAGKRYTRPASPEAS